MRLSVEPVRLAVTSLPSQVGVIRLAAATVASDLDFDIEAIDDIRVAVDELVNALFEAGPRSPVIFEFATAEENFVIEGRASVSKHPRLSALANDVLGVVADGYDLTEADGHAWFQLRKRLVPVASSS
jgi:hypothetical protein